MADDEQSQVGAYGALPPIFDVPEFAPLRRVVPLPKRRRTIDAAALEDAPQNGPASADRSSEGESQTIPDELASTLSTSMGLHSYYPPLFNDVQEMFKDDIDARHVNPVDLSSRAHAQVDGYGHNDNDREDGDYTDHLTQPGNTKKRKVPVTLHSRAGDDVLSPADGEEEFSERAFPAERGEAEAEAVEVVPPALPLGDLMKKGKFSRATQAGLQRKELLKNRKRQLASLLGALSHDDSLALDQALSSSYAFMKNIQNKGGQELQGVPIRLSRRLVRRKTRAMSVAPKNLLAPPSSEIMKVPERSFTFEYDSPSSERLRATQEEVAFLHGRFEAELSRQAAKAAEAARQAALVVRSQMQKTKRSERSQQRARISDQLTSGAPLSVDSGKAIATSKSKSKKKKRSALANASNPHHLRNYVPSRLPHSGPLRSTQVSINGQNHLSPAPLRFLSAELPQRKKKTGTGASPTANLTNPEDEWICAFCEYNLFYGDEHSYRRAIRQRKKILSRRRRAMERAAAAAAGRAKGVASPEREDSVADDLTDAFDVSSPEIQAAPKQTRVKEGQDRDRDKDREQGTVY